MTHLPLLILPVLFLSRQDPPSEPPGFDPAARLLAAGREALIIGELGSATVHLKEALELAPGESEIRLLLARTLNDRGKETEALGIIAPSTPPAPSAWLAVELGRALLATGDGAAAEDAFRQALASYPACGAARLELARAQIADERLPEARANLDPLVAQAPDEPAVLIEAAVLLEAEGKTPLAIELLSAAIEREVGALPLRLSLARLLLEADRPTEAWEAVEILVEEPMDVDSMLQVARVAQHADELVEALSMLGVALTADPTHPEVIHDMLELVEDSSILISRLAARRIDANPGDHYAWGELLEEHLNEGRAQEVLDALAGAPIEVFEDAEVRLHEATALRRVGRTAEARAKLESLVQADPSPEVFYELGLLEYTGGAFQASEAAFARAAEDDHAPDAHYNRGLCLRKLEKHADAAKAFEEALAAKGDFLEACLELGRECRYRLGDTPRARRAFARYLELGGDDAEIRRWMEEGR
jgi:tetratricopeptide (TPR) repeat protein